MFHRQLTRAFSASVVCVLLVLLYMISPSRNPNFYAKYTMEAPRDPKHLTNWGSTANTHFLSTEFADTKNKFFEALWKQGIDES